MDLTASSAVNLPIISASLRLVVAWIDPPHALEVVVSFFVFFLAQSRTRWAQGSRHGSTFAVLVCMLAAASVGSGRFDTVDRP
jgi:hypothetical protein